MLWLWWITQQALWVLSSYIFRVPCHFAWLVQRLYIMKHFLLPYKLLGEPGKLIASLMILQLRDLISFYICHNVGFKKKKIIEELTCFIKLLLQPHNQMGVFIIVILATRHWLTSDTALVGMILSNPCSQPTCFPHQHILSDLYNHGKWVFLDGSGNVTQRSYSYSKMDMRWDDRFIWIIWKF